MPKRRQRTSLPDDFLKDLLQSIQEIGHVTGRLEAVVSELSHLRNHTKQMEQNLQEVREQLSDLQQSVKDLEHRIESLEDDIAHLHTNNNNKTLDRILYLIFLLVALLAPQSKKIIWILEHVAKLFGR